MERETFKSRLGFLLLSAGCAIGIGNVWRFPYVVGEYGGGAFVLFYIFFLIIVGVPVLSMEFAIGRASKKSTVKAYYVLEKPGQKWHIHGYIAMIGNYVLMMFYTTVSGWMLHYFYSFMTGKMEGLSTTEVTGAFNDMLSKPKTMTFWMLLVVIIGFTICSFGLQKGVERVTKGMMIALLGIMIVLAVHSFSLNGGLEGLKFYLYPDFERMKQVGIGRTIVAAMNQAFFTLSLGIGAMAIFGSYLDKSRSLLGESFHIACLDTFVAFVSGLIIFPACFAYGVNPDSGPSLIFITLPNVFNAMAGGKIWGSLFFLFMSFAAFSTIIAVFENILACFMDIWPMNRKKAAVINLFFVGIASMPCILGYNLWSGFTPLGANTAVLDLEDFIVSNLLLPMGSVIYLLFCVSKVGWGFSNYQKEANEGKGITVPNWIRGYVTYILPFIILFLFIQGLLGVFH
ncbi:sodium-dependent transporter [Velocimicrobium porci]|uniref:Transporter n=1 Tax=Velocimicrobium porci TaxID=2606634 RepID=A0A6L5XXM0_9FIRM|nr:sodium-dependent transporter [Velocimicrobium porci]MSS63339.1 sodium-dependent transporter [Velocimicrobium porci]